MENNRRSFLKSSALIGGALITSPQILKGDEEFNQSKKTKVNYRKLCHSI